MSEEQISPWDRLPNEPTRWYDNFVRYYLSQMGVRRIATAYLNYSRDRGPDQYKEALARRGAPHEWYVMAERWRWEERGLEYDSFATEQAAAIVGAALRRLRELTLNAVAALEIQLQSDRYAVQAANSILDRGGIPAQSRQEVVNTVKLSTDDMKAATEELRQWESERFKKNG